MIDTCDLPLKTSNNPWLTSYLNKYICQLFLKHHTNIKIMIGINKITKIVFIALTFMLFACNSTTTETSHNAAGTAKTASSAMHKIIVEEVLQTSSYTYLFASQENQKVWIAIPKREVAIGETYYYKGGMEMIDFKSKELDRTFEHILFVEGISKTPVEMKRTKAAQAAANMQKPAGSKPAARGVIAKIDHKADETSLAQIFADPNSFANKTINVRGTVVKVNENIMGKNWLHIQDGTEYKGLYDLVITTNAQVKMGSVIGVKGTIFLNKDFGSGYTYDVIMENATVESVVQL